MLAFFPGWRWGVLELSRLLKTPWFLRLFSMVSTRCWWEGVTERGSRNFIIHSIKHRKEIPEILYIENRHIENLESRKISYSNSASTKHVPFIYLARRSETIAMAIISKYDIPSKQSIQFRWFWIHSIEICRFLFRFFFFFVSIFIFFLICCWKMSL